MDGDDSAEMGMGVTTPRIDQWRTPLDIMRRATYDDRYAEWVEQHAPEGTEEAIREALDHWTVDES